MGFEALEDHEKENLESIIDGHGLSALLWAAEAICLEKADHLRTNWQDEQAAKRWIRDAAKFAKLAMKIEN